MKNATSDLKPEQFSSWLKPVLEDFKAEKVKIPISFQQKFSLKHCYYKDPYMNFYNKETETGINKLCILEQPSKILVQKFYTNTLQEEFETPIDGKGNSIIIALTSLIKVEKDEVSIFPVSYLEDIPFNDWINTQEYVIDIHGLPSPSDYPFISSYNFESFFSLEWQLRIASKKLGLKEHDKMPANQKTMHELYNFIVAVRAKEMNIEYIATPEVHPKEMINYEDGWFSSHVPILLFANEKINKVDNSTNRDLASLYNDILDVDLSSLIDLSKEMEIL